MERIGDFTLTWGESLRWDERRQRLYFVDTAAETLHWLDDAEPPLNTMALPSKATGVVLTDDVRLVSCLEDGLHVIDPDARTTELLSPYPAGLSGRANDANADGHGRLITGTLNLAPGPGSLWQFSSSDGWTLLHEPFGNANGPLVLHPDGDTTLVFADTLAQVMYGFPYDSAAATVGPPRVLCDHALLGGMPDGAVADGEEGVWSCVLGTGQIVRVTSEGIDRLLDVPMVNPSDVTFGGADLNHLYITSIVLDLGAGIGEHAGGVVAYDVGVGGRPEHRFHLPS